MMNLPTSTTHDQAFSASEAPIEAACETLIQGTDAVVEPPPASNRRSLAALWAHKYLLSVAPREEPAGVGTSLAELTSPTGRSLTAKRLVRNLTRASAQAWSKTETLLATEVQRHGIDPSLINPWQIAQDSHQVFQHCLDAYAEGMTPQRLSVVVGPEIGDMRQTYTQLDPRTLGFVSMQFHYTGIMLLKQLSPLEQTLFAPYLKVMDDYLYMPLYAAYAAAANHAINSPVLAAVQQLLPLTTRIANDVCDRVSRLHPDYESHSGTLNSTIVRTSSLRDVEMFQVYLCLCVLEDSLRSVQQELFPLCVMLYPSLGVEWSLVQEMLQAIGWEVMRHIAPTHRAVFLPYLQTLMDLFSPAVFGESEQP